MGGGGMGLHSHGRTRQLGTQVIFFEKNKKKTANKQIKPHWWTRGPDVGTLDCLWEVFLLLLNSSKKPPALDGAALEAVTGQRRQHGSEKRKKEKRLDKSCEESLQYTFEADGNNTQLRGSTVNQLNSPQLASSSLAGNTHEICFTLHLRPSALAFFYLGILIARLHAQKNHQKNNKN